MRGEDVGLLDDGRRLVKGLAGAHQLQRTFQRQEGRMAFVHVPDVRRIAQLPQRAHAAHAQQDLLRNAHFQVIAVQARGQLAVAVVILIQVGVQQVQQHPPHAYLPDAREHAAARQLHRDGHRFALRILHGQDRHLIEIEDEVARFLPAVFGDVLGKIALVIDETNSHQGNAQVTGFLQMIAGQHAQAASVHRQRFVQAKLERKVGHLLVAHLREGRRIPGILRVQIGVKVFDDAVVKFEVIAVIGNRVQQRTFHLLQECDRVVIQRIPERLVDLRKQHLRFRVPHPPQVIGQLAQPVDAAGQAKTIWEVPRNLFHVRFHAFSIKNSGSTVKSRFLC